MAEQTTPVLLTDNAVEMVLAAMKEEGLDGHGLRVAVKGGGCSGLEYALDFDTSPRPGDTVFQHGELKVFIDLASAKYLTGTTIDYVKGLHSTGFKFTNPNAQRTCGCGNSFA